MSKYNTKELLLIWLDSLSWLSYENKTKIFDLIKDAKNAKEVLLDKKEALTSLIGENYNALISSATGENIKIITEGLYKSGVTAITKESENYPEDLEYCSSPPLVIYCKGDLSLLKTEKFAIVGSRKSPLLSIELAKNYAVAAADCGFTLITGIAEGVDRAVIDAALKDGLKVISVIAGGINNVYPKSHQSVIEEMAQNGLVIGEYPPEVSSQRFFFPVRNRIIAALSRGVLIVSGSKKSGTVYTGEYALEYGKDLFAIPYGVGVSAGETPNDFIKKGAYLTDRVEDIYEFYGKEKKTEKAVFTEEEKKIINALKGGALHVEKIAEELNSEAYKIMPAVSVLEIKGVVVKSGVNEYALVKTVSED